jgi:4-amino-4-deoxy-L-arabinose transferase-like glycosyltransferase
MPTLIAWIALCGLLAAAYPAAARLLPDSGRALRGSVTLALGAGGLSLVMLWEGLLGIAFTPLGIALPYLAIMLLPLLVVRSRASTQRTAQDAPTAASGRLHLLTLLIAAAILFNAGYWLFHRDDAVAIYQPQAAQMYQLGGLIPLTGADSLYLTYPMHNQLLYTFAYLLSGWENEHLAQFTSALLAVSCLPAAYTFGTQFGGRQIGALAALLLAVTPTFGRWASSGYVDLPSAFYYTLAAGFALRLSHSRDVRDAILAGVMLGLAAWTKNAALVGVPLLGAWLGWLWLRRRISARHMLAACLACALIAAPWYIRNLIGAGFLIPDTAWTDQAQRTLDSLLVFATRPENYGIVGWLLIGGISYGLLRARHAPFTLALGWTLPFFAVWWLFASYDPRFLLAILPLLCALAAAFALRLWGALRLPDGQRRYARLVLWAAALLLTGQAVWVSVEYKDEILRAPLMHQDAKRVILGRAPIEP